MDGQTIAQRSSAQGLFRTDAGAQFGANLIGGNVLTGIPVDEGDIVEFRWIGNDSPPPSAILIAQGVAR